MDDININRRKSGSNRNRKMSRNLHSALNGRLAELH